MCVSTVNFIIVRLRHIFSPNIPEASFQEGRQPLTLTPLGRSIFLGNHLPPPERSLLLFAPTGGPATDPGLIRPGATFAEGEGTEGSASREDDPSSRMGKTRRPGSRGYYDPRSTS